MLRRILVATILISMMAVGWVYFAYKFERIANEEILPKLQNSSSLISFDSEAVVVDKFKFKILLPDVTILPESEDLKIKTDKIIIGYHPFADKIILNFIGDKLTIGEKFYFANPNHVIDFSRGLIKKDFQEFSFNIKSENPELYYTKDDSSITESELIDFTISKALDTENSSLYKMIISLHINALKTNVESEFFKEIATLVKSEFGDVFNNTASYSEYKELFGSNDKVDYQLYYSAKLPKETTQELIDASLEEQKTKDILFDLLKSTKIYAFRSHERVKTPLTRYNSTFELNGNGRETAFLFSGYDTKNINEEQNEFVTKNGAHILLNIINIMSKKYNYTSTLFQNITASDLEKILEVILKVKKSNYQFSGRYNVSTNNFQHNFKSTINDFDISFNGKGIFESKSYKGKLEISDPKDLTDNISQIYITAIEPILLKLNNPPKELNIPAYNQMAVNIQDNGFDAIAAFHENDSLKENERFISNLTFNLNDFKFNINDKSFLKFLTDERVVKFLQAVPNTDNTAVK